MRARSIKATTAKTAKMIPGIVVLVAVAEWAVSDRKEATESPFVAMASGRFEDVVEAVTPSVCSVVWAPRNSAVYPPNTGLSVNLLGVDNGASGDARVSTSM
jgi:hypothetical protein